MKLKNDDKVPSDNMTCISYVCAFSQKTRIYVNINYLKEKKVFPSDL